MNIFLSSATAGAVRIHLFVEFNLIIRVRVGAADLQNSCDNNSAEFRVLISQRGCS